MVTKEFLDNRARKSMKKGFSKQRWITFCEIMLRRGYQVDMYEARKTVSKYITVKKEGKSFKVRFSNHPPIYERENRGDCDFFVGRTNFRVNTTGDAVRAVINFFENDIRPEVISMFEDLTTTKGE